MRFFRSLLAALTLCVLAPAAHASQGSGCLPLTGVYSGLTAAIDINAAVAALISTNSGAAAPATDCSGAAIAWQQWGNSSSGQWEIYDGSQWKAIGTLDSVNHLWLPPIGGGVQTLASASTTDLCAAPQTFVTITGSTTINSFGSSCNIGQARFVNFSSVLTVAYSSSAILLPTAANVATQAGDQAITVYLGGGVWRVASYTRADGSALSITGLVPSHTVAAFNLTSCPTGWTLADGTGGKVNMQGVVARGYDPAGTRDPSGTAVGGYEADTLESFTAKLSSPVVTSLGLQNIFGLGAQTAANSSGTTSAMASTITLTGTGGGSFGNETRAKATVLLYCEKS